MSRDRRFEYDKGPTLEDERETAAESDEPDEDDRNEPVRGARPVATVAPWKGGIAAGVSAFGVMVAAFYQLVSALGATGAYSQDGNGPSDWVMTGLTALANHGVAIQRDGEPIEGIGTFSFGLTPYVTGLVPAVILTITGYLLVRYVRLETRREAGLALGSLVASYVVPTIGLATITRWTPEQGADAAQEMTTIAAATGVGAVSAVASTALVFAAIGAGVAALPQLLPADR